MAMGELSTYLYKLTKLLVLLLLTLSSYYLINIGNNYVDENKKIKLNTRKIIPVIGAFFVLFLINKLFKRYGILSDMFYTMILSVIVAYLLNPIVNFLTKKGVKNRVFAVLIVYLLILGLIVLFAFTIIPRSSKELGQFILSIPDSMNDLSKMFNNVINKYEEMVGDMPFITDNILKAAKNTIAGFETVLINLIKSTVTGLSGFLTKAVSLILTPILTFYFLVDKDQFLGTIAKSIPEKYEEDSKKLYKEINESLSNFVRGRLLMAVFVGVSTTILLSVLGVGFAVPIGFITGFADIVPYIGPFLGFIPAVLFAFLVSPIKAVWVSIAFVLIQWAENNLIAPKVIGETTGLHPMVVLLAIVIGGGMFGVMGMIFSVPVIAILVVIFKFAKEKMEKSKTNL